MKLNDLIIRFEKIIPLTLQEKWDHCGLNLGRHSQNITDVLFSYDVCLEAIAYAKKKNCQLIVSHHPFRMQADVNLNLDGYEGRIIEACLKNNIALYSAHTNHDVSEHSLNFHYLNKLEIQNIRPLKPTTEELFKLIVFVPQKDTQKVMDAIFQAGGGGIGNYSECSFRSAGLGTFRGDENSNPQLGKKYVRETVEEDRLEILVTQDALGRVIKNMLAAHPYEEVAYDLVRLEKKRNDIGLGALGEWEKARPVANVLKDLKKLFRAPYIRYVGTKNKTIKRIGICTGSGSSLLEHALRAGCDLFITGDVKYHQAIEAKRKDIAIADVGHFYSEIDSVKILKEIFANTFGKELKLHEYTRLKDAFELKT